MKVGSVERGDVEMLRWKKDLGKNVAEIFYKRSLFPVHHLLNDFKHTVCKH